MENQNYMHVEDGSLEKQPEGELTTASTGDVSIEVPPQKSTEQVLNELLENEEVKSNCLINAKDILQRLGNDWFTVDKLIRKTNIKNRDAAKDILDLLCLFGMCYRTTSDTKMIRYKIVLNNASRLAILQEELKEAEAKVTYLKSQVDLIITNTVS